MTTKWYGKLEQDVIVIFIGLIIKNQILSYTNRKLVYAESNYYRIPLVAVRV